MDSFKGQGGIQMLLTAEQEAQQIVSAARTSQSVYYYVRVGDTISPLHDPDQFQPFVLVAPFFFLLLYIVPLVAVKLRRLKQAKDEAEKEAKQNRSQMEAEYQNKIAETSGNSGSTVKRLKEETETMIKSLKESASSVQSEIIDMLIKYVTSVKY